MNVQNISQEEEKERPKILSKEVKRTSNIYQRKTKRIPRTFPRKMKNSTYLFSQEDYRTPSIFINTQNTHQPFPARSRKTRCIARENQDHQVLSGEENKRDTVMMIFRMAEKGENRVKSSSQPCSYFPTRKVKYSLFI